MRRQSIELQQLPSQLDELKMSMSDIKAEWDHYLDTLLAVPTGRPLEALCDGSTRYDID